MTDGPDKLAFSDTIADAEPRVGDHQKLALGDKLGRFDIVKQLGAGGMGVVYVALDPTLNRQVALKLLRSGSLGPLGADDARARLLREAQAMARLSHPNVITVHEVGTTDDQVFVVMELNDGKNLTRWLEDRPRWPEIVRVFIEAGKGLIAAHSAGLIHRDFKPDNVLIARDGRVRVTDFGLVDLATSQPRPGRDSGAPRPSQGGMLGVSLTHTGAVLGTPPYMAPEQHDSQTADERTDQYSFCVSLFEALYGRRPFAGARYRDLVVNILEGNIVSPPADTEVPASLHALILKGLSLERAGRFESMEVLLEALDGELRAPATGPIESATHTTDSTSPTIESAVTMLASPPSRDLPSPPASSSPSSPSSSPSSRRWLLGGLALAVAGAAAATAVVLAGDGVSLLVAPPETPATVVSEPDAGGTAALDAGVLAATSADAAGTERADADAGAPLEASRRDGNRRDGNRRKITDAKTTDTKATDAKATDAKATDAKATDTRSTDTRSTDTKAADTKSTSGETAAERRARELNLGMPKETSP